MDKTIMIFSGRTFTSEDIDLIKWTRKRYPQLSRTELAKTICEFLEWTTPSGRAKSPQCTAFLVTLEEAGLIKLPPLDTSKIRVRNSKLPEFNIDTTPITDELKNLMPIQLEIARAGINLKLWKRYISDYHMIGDKQVCGCQLAYFIKSKETILGCLQFSASSWALRSRDEWVGWKVQDRLQRLNLIVNNSRFLILPWVNVKNLASKVLSLAIKQIQEDWLREYCYAPVLLETFVDTSHFAGTCYKASNWRYLGETQGRGRMDTKREYALSRKAIYMYPLQNDFRDCLKGIKPCKVVNPDD
ncbi:MAG TPA: Druantia anti-phage system protein DruA [Desulfosporosinus sp.]|nr:Druantia anti-phage system protein DruA [Desulfosporosinus sp.]